MSEFVAGAFVDVKPDAKGFRTDLKRQVDAQIKTAIKIPVELDPQRFKSTVNAAAKQTAAKVPIVPSTSVAELRTAIKAKLDSAVKGLKIKVPIEVEQAGPGSRGGLGSRGGVGGTGGGRRSSPANQAKSLTDAERQQIAVNNALARSQQQLAISSKAFEDAQKGGITSEERLQRLRESRTASTRAARAANDVLAVSEGKLTDQQRTALESASREATSTRATVTEKLKAAATDAKVAAVQEKANLTRTQAATVMAVEVKEIKSLSELKAVENDLTSVEARLKSQANAARKLSATAIADENAGLLHQIEERKLLIAEQRAELKGEGSRARQQKTAARGFGATGLSLLGVRGATLAASNAFLVGAASAAVFAKTVKSFADLETQLNVFRATANATADQMKRVSEEAQRLGRDVSLPSVTAADAASAMTELSRAGLSVEDSMAGARGVLQLAAAAQISNAEAATLAATALNAFGLEGEQAAHVADLLSNAANSSQGSITEMGAAMAQATAIARQVGISLEDTFAILTQFARSGLRGSDAGTSLRTALSRLIAPTKQASDLIAALGLNLRDTNGNLRPDIFVQFGQATKNLSPELRDMIAQTIAGQDAIRAFSIGAREGARGLKLAQLQMEATGTAERLAAARAQGLAGKFSALASNVQTFGTQLGKFAAGPVAISVKGLNDLFVALNQLFTGDFSGFLKTQENDFNQFIANVKSQVGGIPKILFAKSPGEAFGGLKQLFENAPAVDKETERIQHLQEALTRLQNLRLQAFNVGSNIGPLTEEIKRLQRELKAAKVDAGLIIPVTKLEKQLFPLREARKEAADLRNEILGSGGSPARVKFLDDLIHNFDVRIKLAQRVAKQNAKKLREDVEGELSGLDIAKSFEAQFKLIAGNIDLATPEVLNGLSTLARKIKGAAPVTGAAGQEVGKRLMESINKSIKAAVENDDPDLAAALKRLAEKISALFGVELGKAFKDIKVPLTDQQLEDALLPSRIKVARAVAFGSIDAQIAAHQDELAKLKKQLRTVVKGSAQEEKILNDIGSEQEAIRSLREQKAQAAKEANQKSSEKITNAINAQEQVLLNKLTIAKEDDNLKNDLRAQAALRNFYTRQIAVAKATIRDAETKRDTVNALEQKLFDINNDITETRIARRKQLAKPIDDAAERAQETETLKDDVKQASRRVVFWKNQVKVLKNLVKARKATVAELRAAQSELNDAEAEFEAQRRAFRQQKRDLREQSLQLDISFFQTTGNVNAEIAARKRFIAFLEGQKKFFKGNTIKMKELRNAIAEQNAAIKDLMGESEKGGTTLADLFTQQVAITKQAGIDVPVQVPGNVTQPIEDEVTRRLRARANAANLAGSLQARASAMTSSKKPIITVDDVVDPAVFTTLEKLDNEIKKLFVVGHPSGLIEPGNINLLGRPSVNAPRGEGPPGTQSSVRSISVGIGEGLTALIPTVIKVARQGWRVVSDDAAIQRFRQTGQHLGIFNSEKAANTYAEALHLQQQNLQKLKDMTPGTRVSPLEAPKTLDATVSRQVASNAELIKALDRLALVFSGRSVTNRTNQKDPEDQAASASAARYNAMARFWRAHKNRNLHEETAGA